MGDKITAPLQAQAPQNASPSGGFVDVEKKLTMKGGSSDDSYAYNSSLQAGMIQFTEDVFMQGLQRMHLPLHGPIRIADLGCSSGPNTVSAVNSIVNKLQQRYESEGHIIPEFVAFFSDLASNDFNCLFSIIPRHIDAEAATTNDLNNRSYFVAGVPGSFYRRLFPSASMHAIYTANSLHWLSKVPDAVQNRLSPAWNKGKCWISPSNKIAAQEYSNQAKEDLYKFIDCRAKEMVSGGLLMISTFGRVSIQPENQFSFIETDNKDFTYIWHMEFNNCWNDLIKENIVKEEVRDSFNFPLYYRNIEEFEAVIQEFSEYFIIHDLKLVQMCGIEFTKNGIDGSEDSGWYIDARSVFGPIIEAHVGSSISEMFFQRLKVRATLCMKQGDKASKHVILVASLFRK